MPASRSQKTRDTIPQVRAAARIRMMQPSKLKPSTGTAPNRMVVTNAATGQPELWDIPSWDRKQIDDLIRKPHQSRGWLPHGVAKPTKSKPLDPEYLAELKAWDQEHNKKLCLEAEQNLAKRARVRRLEEEAEQKDREAWAAAHPYTPPDYDLLRRVMSDKKVAEIADKVLQPQPWVTKRLEEIPSDFDPRDTRTGERRVDVAG
ncbi:hypothetical protein WOLCODRAFT_159062 [Wolfiporia cocos MD-104 SS10]|uniref:Uncharacterized protein n=1 Tax=Wolfiporia cocos (strain MD-104) TaxID=742152 RepID=A0A2H3JS60_WOLCO|nr:hypothetical protein WOLCODRAFT_159062 [Wolfiporia cocos MD-104 SS10]